MWYRSLVAAVAIALLVGGSALADPDPVTDEVEWRTDEHLLTGKPAFGDESSPIRPGAQLDNHCTYNFVFYDPTTEGDPPVYIGTAAHCTDKLGERVSVGSMPIGTVVYDSDLVDSAVDFALIKIDRSMVGRTNPKVLGWGGPRGIVGPAGLTRTDQLDLHGHGLGVSLTETTRKRWGLLMDWTKDEYVADMPAVNGDSGGPLIHDRTGKALGIISRYGFWTVPPATDTGPLMPYIFRELNKAGFDNVVLATAN